jgi:hypothetical protein
LRHRSAPPAAAAPPPLVVSPVDVDLFRSLLEATGGHVVTDQPRGTGITNLDMVKAMVANGASLEQDILPTIRRHADELVLRARTVCGLGRGLRCGIRDRPATGQIPGRSIRLPDELWTAIDDWRRQQPDIPTRTESIRRLLAQALGKPK